MHLCSADLSCGEGLLYDMENKGLYGGHIAPSCSVLSEQTWRSAFSWQNKPTTKAALCFPHAWAKVTFYKRHLVTFITSERSRMVKIIQSGHHGRHLCTVTGFVCVCECVWGRERLQRGKIKGLVERVVVNPREGLQSDCWCQVHQFDQPTAGSPASSVTWTDEDTLKGHFSLSSKEGRKEDW